MTWPDADNGNVEKQLLGRPIIERPYMLSRASDLVRSPQAARGSRDQAST